MTLALHSQGHCSTDKLGIYLFSPSGVVRDRNRLLQAKTHLNDAGYRVSLDRHVFAEHERFAGTDAQRLQAIDRSLKQRLPIVMATRGGYGLTRLLPYIDWNSVAESNKKFVGHSDFTAFQLALLAQTSQISYAGPMAIFDFGGKRVDEVTLGSFQELLANQLELLAFESEAPSGIDLTGVLWGGNLSIISSLVGTPYLPKTKGILFLEDINEHPYRIERMLSQLLMAGILQKQKAILLGSFTDYHLSPHDGGFDLPAVVKWLNLHCKVPVVTGLPFGHIKTKVSLPIGVKVGLATEQGMAYLVLH